MTTCAIYIRKSREEKDKPSHRLTVQRQQLPAHAQAHGWQVEIYDDGHASAARGKAENLPERSRLEADIRAGKINILLCIELSRLSRDDTLQDYTAWLALCSQYHVKLATPSRILDPAQHSDWMLLIMEGGFSSVEMKILQGRMKEGRDEAYRSGHWLGGPPPPPYRYDHEAGRPVIDTDQLPRMQQLWSLAETHSANAVAIKMGMPLIAVRRAISDERLLIYQAKRIDTETMQTIPCDWQPCMDAEQAMRIRAARRTRKNLHGAKATYAALLSNLGILRCGYCGATAKTWQGKGDRPADQRNYYGCQKKNGKTCPESRMIRQNTLNDLITTNLIRTLQNIDTMRGYWQAASASESDAAIKNLRQQEKEAQAAKQRIIQAIGAGIIEWADAKQQVDAATAAIEAARSQLQQLSQPTEQPDWDSLTVAPEDWQTMPTDIRRGIIAAAIKQIDLYHSYAIITYRFPRSESGNTTSRIHLPAPLK